MQFILQSFVGVLLVFLNANFAWALNCPQVRQLTTQYLNSHYAYNQFNDDLSARTFDLLVKNFDPGKLYFYKADVDSFKQKYETKLDDLIKEANCDVLSDIQNIFAKRFEERQNVIKNLIKQKYKFDEPDFMEVDRKKIEFAATTEELNERWRQRVKFQIMQLKKGVKDEKQLISKLQKRYDLLTKQQNEQKKDDLYERFLSSFAAALDPHTEYYSPDQLEDFRIGTRLSLEGIGAVLRSEDGYTVVQSLVPGGAAANSGKIKVDDKIIAVAQETGSPIDVIDMDLREVVKLIRGKGGTKVNLTVMREKSGKSETFVVQLVREKVQLTDRVAKAKVFDTVVKRDGQSETLKVAVLNLPSFYVDFEGQHSRSKDFRSSARDVSKELQRLKKEGKIDALVLDLRVNGGGSLKESIDITGYFIDRGPVVQIKEADGNVYAQYDSDGTTLYDGPLVVLTSRQSASASEIFAGAIQDYGRGIIVGDDHTFGKGTVQNLNDIGPKLGATKVTISKFYRPSGSSTQLNGVPSDIVLPSLLGEIELGEKYYDFAMAWDQIKKSDFKGEPIARKEVKELAKRSEKRVAKDKNFDDVRKAIEEYRKNEKERTRISLNEKDETNKKAEAKKEDVEDFLDETDLLGGEVKLEKDPTLQESVRIAADYSLMQAKKPLGDIVIPDLEKKAVAQESKGKGKKAKKAN